MNRVPARLLAISLIIFLALIIYSNITYTYSEQIPGSKALPPKRAEITLRSETGGILTVYTDENGVATFLAKSISHELTVNSPGSVSRSLQVDFSLERSISVSLPPSPVITGRVTIEGEPAVGVMVTVGELSTITDGEGRFYIMVDRPLGSRVTLSVSPNGDMGHLRRMMDIFLEGILPFPVPFPEFMRGRRGGYLIPRGANGFAVGKTLDLTINNMVTNITIDLERSITISGTVSDGVRPIPNAVIMLLGRGILTGFSMDVSRPDGRFKLNYGITPGEYTIMVVATGYQLYMENITVTTDLSLDIVLGESPVLKCRVITKDGHPIRDALVFLTHPDAPRWPLSFTTNASGEFMATYGLFPGEWNITVLAYGALFNETIVVNPGMNIHEIVLPITMVTITGEIDDPDRVGLIEAINIEVVGYVEMGFISWPVSLGVFPISKEGSFTLTVPKNTTLFGQDVSITRYELKVRGPYYYDQVSVNIDATQPGPYDVGRIEVDTGILVEVTINVSFEAGEYVSMEMSLSLLIEYDGMEFTLNVTTNSSFGRFGYYLLNPGVNGSITIELIGQAGTEGYLKMVIPKAYMAPPYIIKINGVPAPDDTVTIVDRGASVEIYVRYSHSSVTFSVESTNVIPEIPLGLPGILLMGLLALLIIVRGYRLKTGRGSSPP